MAQLVIPHFFFAKVIKMKGNDRMAYTIKKQIRQGLPQVGVAPYGQIHLHSTANPNSTAQNEADYHDRRPVESGFFSHVVGNGIVIQTAPINRGAYDVGGGWNSWGYAQLELIESHKTKAEFEKDYKIYVELARDLAKEAGIPLKLDEGNVGLITHEYATKHQPNNKSDHVDPYPYLAKWGITRAQFKKDIENGISGGSSTVAAKTYIKNARRVEVIAEKGDQEYKDLDFKEMVGNYYAKGSKLLVKEVVKHGNITRLKLESGGYFTANEAYVKKLR